MLKDLLREKLLASVITYKTNTEMLDELKSYKHAGNLYTNYIKDLEHSNESLYKEIIKLIDSI